MSDAYRRLGGALLSQLPQTPNLKRALRRTREADRKRHLAEGVGRATPRDANLTDFCATLFGSQPYLANLTSANLTDLTDPFWKSTISRSFCATSGLALQRPWRSGR